MPPCTGCGLQVAEGALVCPACKMSSYRGRKRSFLIGAALALTPGLFYILWVGVLGLDFLAKRAPLFRIDERLVYMEYCFGGVIVEIAALWFLDRTLRRPIDLLTVAATLLAIVSMPLAILMSVVIIVIGMGG